MSLLQSPENRLQEISSNFVVCQILVATEHSEILLPWANLASQLSSNK